MNLKLPQVVSDFKDEPWLAWLLTCLVRQLKRQRWLLSIDKELKQAQLGQTGVIPGMPEWSFFYHGIGLSLHGPSNEIIDVDFHDEGVETIDSYFLARRVIEYEPAPLPEERLRSWLPDQELIVAGIRELQKGPLVSENSHTFQLNNSFKKDWDLIEEVDLDNTDNFRYWKAEIEKYGSSIESSVLKDKHQDWLLKILEKEGNSPSLLKAIAKAISLESQKSLCMKYINDEIDHFTAAAVQVLHDRDDAPTDEISNLLPKLNPKKHHPYIAWVICRFLLARDIRPDICMKIIKKFSDQRIFKRYLGNPLDYELAHLALSYNPEIGVPLLRRSLRSKTPLAVEASAALLSVIDAEWCHGELIDAALSSEHSKKPENRRYLAAALVSSFNEKIRQKGTELTPSSRKREKGEIGYTFDEVIEANMDDFFNHAREKARDDVKVLNLIQIKKIVRYKNAKKPGMHWFSTINKLGSE